MPELVPVDKADPELTYLCLPDTGIKGMWHQLLAQNCDFLNLVFDNYGFIWN